MLGISIPCHILVSIIMINEHVLSYINKTIETIRKLTYENWELIMIENMSKDESASAIKE